MRRGGAGLVDGRTDRGAAVTVFVVEVLRWGDREQHSYVIGVFSSENLAVDAGKKERESRGGKYEYAISEHEVDE